MKTEKIVLSFVGILLGLLVAALAFYFFQFSKNTPPKEQKITIIPATPTPSPSILLSLSNPKDEAVVSKPTITVAGTAKSDSTVIILVNGAEDIIKPSISGNFSADQTIIDGQNIIEVISIGANGEKKSIKQTITYSTEDF